MSKSMPQSRQIHHFRWCAQTECGQINPAFNDSEHLSPRVPVEGRLLIDSAAYVRAFVDAGGTAIDTPTVYLSFADAEVEEGGTMRLKAGEARALAATLMRLAQLADDAFPADQSEAVRTILGAQPGYVPEGGIAALASAESVTP